MVRHKLINTSSLPLDTIRLQNTAFGNFLPCSLDRSTGEFACVYQSVNSIILVFDEQQDGEYEEVALGYASDVGAIQGSQSFNLRNGYVSFVGSKRRNGLYITTGQIR